MEAGFQTLGQTVKSLQFTVLLIPLQVSVLDEFGHQGKDKAIRSDQLRLSKGEILYYHPVLEAKLVTSNGFVFSLMTEFIENADLQGDKQDCELKAFYRLTKRLKARFHRLPICLLLDGLYAGGPTFQLCQDYDWRYLIVLQDDDLPQVHRSFEAVMSHLPHNQKQVCLGKKG